MFSESMINQAFALYVQNHQSNILDFIVLQLSNGENERIVISQINKMINSSVSRFEAFKLLKCLLPHMSSDAIMENNHVWFRNCLNHHEEDKNKDIYLNLLGCIIGHCKNNPDFDKKFVADYLAPCMQSCINEHVEINVKMSSLNVIIQCLSKYSSSCNPYKAKIEKYLMKHLDADDEKVIELAGLAFFYSQKIGNAGCDGMNYVANISLAIKKLSVNIHNFFNNLFADEIVFDDMKLPSVEPYEIKIPPVHYSYDDTLKFQFCQLRNCFHFLRTLIGKATEKKVDVKEVLDLIKRGLTIHICLEETESFKVVQKSIYLIALQKDILELLETFFLAFGYHLMPYFHTISKIVLDQLIKTHDCKCFSSNSIFQESVYRVLNSWLKMAKNGFNPIHQEKLIQCIIKDSFPTNQGVTLKVNFKGNKKEKFNNTVTAKEKIKLNSATEALRCLNTLLCYSRLEITSPLLKKLFENITNMANSVLSGKAVYPFNEEQCQIILFKIISSFYNQNNVKILPPLTESLIQLKHGSLMENKKNSSNCFKSLQALEKLAQPVCSSLYVYEKSEKILENDDTENLSKSIKKFKELKNEENSTKIANVSTNGINIISDVTVNQQMTNFHVLLKDLKNTSYDLVLQEKLINYEEKHKENNIILEEKDSPEDEPVRKKIKTTPLQSSEDKDSKNNETITSIENEDEDDFLSSFVDEPNDSS